MSDKTEHRLQLVSDELRKQIETLKTRIGKLCEDLRDRDERIAFLERFNAGPAIKNHDAEAKLKNETDRYRQRIASFEEQNRSLAREIEELKNRKVLAVDDVRYYSRVILDGAERLMCVLDKDQAIDRDED